MNNNDDGDPALISALENLRDTAARDPRTASIKRAAFIAEAKEISRGVSPGSVRRLDKWMASLSSLFTSPEKEKIPVFQFALSLIVALGLIFGGGSVAVAQSSMPDDTLYGLKIQSEETRLALANEPQAQLRLVLEFTARRTEELRTMLQDGKVPPEAVVNRLQTQLDTALRIGVNLETGDAKKALLQIQTQLQQQEQIMAKLNLNEPALLKVRDRVQTTLQLQSRLAQAGIADPQWLQEQLRIRAQEQQRNNSQGQQNQNQNPNGAGNGTSVGPGPGGGTSTGPGDGTCPNCPSGGSTCTPICTCLSGNCDCGGGTGSGPQATPIPGCAGNCAQGTPIPDSTGGGGTGGRP